MNVAPAYGVPTIQEELDRKTFETIEWLFTSFDNGRMTNEQFSTGVDALFMAVSGLVDESFLELVTEAQKLCGTDKPTVKRIFGKTERGENRQYVLKWVVGNEGYTINYFKDGQFHERKVDLVSAKQALFMMSGFAKKLKREGWIEL